MGWQLVFTDSGRRATLPAGSALIGSAPRCDIRVDHPTVSRRHARLHAQGGRVHLEDLGSSNGTRVNGRLVRDRIEIEPPATVEFGLVSARLLPLDASDAQAAVRLDREVARETRGSRAQATLVAEGASRFAVDVLPDLLALARRHRDPAAVAAQVYAALRRGFDSLRFAIGTERGGVLAGGIPDAEAGVDAFGAGRFVIRMHGPRAERINAAPAVELCVGLLDLVDGAPDSDAEQQPRVSTPARASRPQPPTVDRAMNGIYDRAERVAASSLNVLVQGETGTGKELLARFIHAASGRDGNFVAVNCAALSRELLEAELFGIEAGVATGVHAREGRFRQADGGTLLLDEVTEMPDDCQAKLLRVLQEREVVAVGARDPRSVDVRVIAATNRALSARSDSAGPLRPDLVHRLSGWSVVLPPLRERRADIPQLAAHFFECGAAAAGRGPAGISRAAMDILCAYDWPGNVRELEQEMQRAALFVDDGELLSPTHLSPTVTECGAELPALNDVSADAERRAIEQALGAAGGNATRAARTLGISRATLYRRIREFGIERNGGSNA
jgi:DNA-binding NtrC family response regulator